jgi:hypothetical protein
MKLIPSVCMMIGHLEYYHLLSKIVRLLDPHNPSQARKLFVSWIEDGQEILILHQIVRDSQWIENQASASQFIACNHKPSSLDTIWLISYNLKPEPMLNFDQIFTPKGNVNKCFISSKFVATILLGMLNTGLRLLSSRVITRSRAQSGYLEDNELW